MFRVGLQMSGRGGNRGRGRGAPPPPPPTMTAAEVLAMQGQFMQSMMQFFQNQPIGAPAPPPPRDKRREFMQGHPPVFSHAADPLEADDWLRAVEKQLNIAQCDDQQKVLYASGQL